MAAATALPDTRATANEIAVHWEKAILDKEKFFETVEHALFLMTSAAHTPAVLSAAAPARALDAVSAPHKGAEVEREGGSLDMGTTGKLTGETAQFAVRVAYRRWAKGLARCMGEVLLAARGRTVSKDTVLGPEGDFGVESAFQNVSEDMPAERLRSIGRYLLEELHVACGWHRAEPGNALPDVLAIRSSLPIPIA
ncbi:hypothetical protein AB1Y20_023012 [Prymnesium parvum]|uniref:Uncharacterized protein n=1 Tax=Prymnesium parvum TaxID=97485 RepID=A0AB34JBY0_PRYPA